MSMSAGSLSDLPDLFVCQLLSNCLPHIRHLPISKGERLEKLDIYENSYLRNVFEVLLSHLTKDKALKEIFHSCHFKIDKLNMTEWAEYFRKRVVLLFEKDGPFYTDFSTAYLDYDTEKWLIKQYNYYYPWVLCKIADIQVRYYKNLEARKAAYQQALLASQAAARKQATEQALLEGKTVSIPPPVPLSSSESTRATGTTPSPNSSAMVSSCLSRSKTYVKSSRASGASQTATDKLYDLEDSTPDVKEGEVEATVKWFGSGEAPSPVRTPPTSVVLSHASDELKQSGGGLVAHHSGSAALTQVSGELRSSGSGLPPRHPPTAAKVAKKSLFGMLATVVNNAGGNARAAVVGAVKGLGSTH